MATSKPDTIVMIHGLWMTPRSWEHWKERYEARGYTVHAPPWPGFESEVEALNADPSPMTDLGAETVIESYETFIKDLPTTPIIMGHVPPKATMHNERKYDDSVSITEYKEFEGRPHFPGAPGWEEVADFAVDWAERHAGLTVSDHDAAGDAPAG